MPEIEPIDTNAYFYYSVPSTDGAAISGTDYPVTLNYFFTKDISCPEHLLPFVKTNIMLKNFPEAIFDRVGIVASNSLDNRRYRELKGDSTIIYQGFTPPASVNGFVTQEQIDNNEVPNNNKSKRWVVDTDNTIYFIYTLATDPGAIYKIEIGTLTNISVTYNTHLADDSIHEDHETFENVLAVDAISTSQLTGQGFYTKYEWIFNGLDWEEQITEDNNKQQTVPLFSLADKTVITFTGSFITRNGVFFASGIRTITFETGNASLSALGLISNTYWVFYSDKRVKLLVLSFAGILSNLPNVDDYQTGTLPYTNLFIKVNPDPYPVEQAEEYFVIGNRTEEWLKLTNDEIPTFRFRISGIIPLVIPATKEVEDNYFWVEETYSQVGDTYERDVENRDALKPKIVYFPDLQPIQGKLDVVLKNPFDLQQIMTIDEKER